MLLKQRIYTTVHKLFVFLYSLLCRDLVKHRFSLSSKLLSKFFYLYWKKEKYRCVYFDFLSTSQIKTSSAFKIKNCHSAEFYKTFCRFSVWLELCSDMIKTVCWLCSQVSGVDYLLEGGRSEMFGVPGCRVYGRGRDWLAWVMWSACFWQR